MFNNMNFILFPLISIITIFIVFVRSEEPSYCYNRYDSQKPVYVAWQCDEKNGTCSRVRVPTRDSGISKDCLTSLNVCNLLCDPHASLWPFPTGNVSIRKRLVPIDIGNIDFINFSDDNQKLGGLLENLQTYITYVLGNSIEGIRCRKDNTKRTVIKLKLEDKKTTSLTYETLESYHLKVGESNDGMINVEVEADNYFGARHGIETLLQLIVYDEIANSLLIPSDVSVLDAPFYKHRGVLLDTSRYYYPIKAIERLLDGMAYNKMNIFHWHMIDSQSFPFLSQKYPKMAAYGAYDLKKVYTPSDIKYLVEYATARGIKIIPEIDTPAHIGEGWQYFGKDFLLAFGTEPWTNYCLEPPCGILNPLNERVYDVLEDLYSEFNQLFNTDVFHMGGDELKFVAWNETRSILDWFSAKNMSRSTDNFIQLWATFQQKAADKFYKTVEKNKKPKIALWSSELTTHNKTKEFLDPSSYIVQLWGLSADKQVVNLLSDGYQVILSNVDYVYLDLGFGNWLKECGLRCLPYIYWQRLYSYDLIGLVNNLTSSSRGNLTSSSRVAKTDLQSQILGSEACLWSEQSDQHTMDQRIWPRAAALAERLWSNPSGPASAALNRLLRQRERMASRNISPDVLQPFWCNQNQGLCHE